MPCISATATLLTPFKSAGGSYYIKRLFLFADYCSEIKFYRPKRLIRLLTIVSFPCTLRQLHIGEHSFKRRLLGRTSVDTETNLASTFVQVTHAHLRETFSVDRTLYAIVVFTTRKSVPHRFDISRNRSCSPI